MKDKSVLQKKILIAMIKELKEGNNQLLSYAGFCPMGKINPLGTSKQEYFDAIDKVGTSYGLAGIIPKVAPEFADGFIRENGKYNFFKMRQAVLGLTEAFKLVEGKTKPERGEADKLEMFCFSPNWESNKEMAIERIQHVLDTGTYKEGFSDDLYDGYPESHECE